LKKTRFSPKNERACCIPRPKFAERPYLAGPKPTFLDPFFGAFRPSDTPPNTTATPEIVSLVFLDLYFIFIFYPNLNSFMTYTHPFLSTIPQLSIIYLLVSSFLLWCFSDDWR